MLCEFWRQNRGKFQL